MIRLPRVNPKNVSVETYFLKFDLKLGCLITAGIGIFLSILLITTSSFQLGHECIDAKTDCLEMDKLKGYSISKVLVKFFKFMIVLHVFTLLADIALAAGALLEMELLLSVWLAYPTWLSYCYSCVYSFIVFGDFYENHPEYNSAGFSFAIIGLIFYLVYLVYAWICVYSFSKKVTEIE